MLWFPDSEKMEVEPEKPAKHIPNGLQGTLPNWFHGLKTAISGGFFSTVYGFRRRSRCLHPHLFLKKSQVKTVEKTCDWCMSKGLKVEYPKTYPLVNHPQKRWPFFMAYEKSILRPKHHVSGWVNFTLFYTCTPVYHHFIPLLIYVSHVFAGLNIYLLIASAI